MFRYFNRETRVFEDEDDDENEDDYIADLCKELLDQPLERCILFSAGSRAVDSAVIVDTDACASYTGATMAKEGKQSDKSRIEVHASSVSKAHVQPRLVPDIEELKKSVSVDEIRKQGFKAKLPRTIEIVPSTDHSGESSLDVIVVFPKNLRDEDVTSPQTSKMLSWIQDTILSKPESGGRWPYVFVKVDSKDACPA